MIANNVPTPKIQKGAGLVLSAGLSLMPKANKVNKDNTKVITNTSAAKKNAIV
jgi:hypothetical protein